MHPRLPLKEGTPSGSPVPPRHSTLSETDFVAFDTELTGLDYKRDSIISLGAVRMRGGLIRPGQSFFRLVRPDSELKSQGVVVHGLTHSDLEGADETGKVLGEFLDFIEGTVLVGHFAFIDLNFINGAMERIFGRRLGTPVVDTAEMHRWLCGNDKAYGQSYADEALKSDLFSLAGKHGIELARAHDALYDAFVAAQLFQRLLWPLRRRGVDTLDALLDIARS